ncbi:MAG: hypothetical protein RLZZ28_2360 [Bacteroidota bacterium]|jgi:hypothetical protein
MKKIFLGFTLLVLATATNSFAQVAAPSGAQAPASAAAISFKEADNKHEFGTVPQGTPVSYDFSFTNTGKAPLVLSAVNASCGCTTPEWPKEPVAVGATAKIKVTYNAANPGEFTKTITVVSNAANPQTILTIHGSVKSPAQASTNQAAPAAAPKATAVKKN